MQRCFVFVCNLEMPRSTDPVSLQVSTGITPQGFHFFSSLSNSLCLSNAISWSQWVAFFWATQSAAIHHDLWIICVGMPSVLSEKPLGELRSPGVSTCQSSISSAVRKQELWVVRSTRNDYLYGGKNWDGPRFVMQSLISTTQSSSVLRGALVPTVKSQDKVP